MSAALDGPRIPAAAGRTSQLVVLATEQEQAAVDQLVERLDTQTRQVLIEAQVQANQRERASHTVRRLALGGDLQ